MLTQDKLITLYFKYWAENHYKNQRFGQFVYNEMDQNVGIHIADTYEIANAETVYSMLFSRVSK